MTLNKHNMEYSGGVPIHVGDRYSGQDQKRDIDYIVNLMSMIFAVMAGTPSDNLILKGLEVSQGAGDTLNITAGIGVHKRTITAPDSFATDPPTTTTETQWVPVRIESNLSNQAIAGATLDGVTTNYVKLAYAENASGKTRQRKKKAGTYDYEKVDGYTLTVNSTPATTSELLLATFTGSAGGSFTFSTSSKSSTQLSMRQLRLSGDNDDQILSSINTDQASAEQLSVEHSTLDMLIKNKLNGKLSFWTNNLERTRILNSGILENISDIIANKGGVNGENILSGNQVSIGGNRSNDGFTGVYLYSQSSGALSAKIERNSGANNTLVIQNEGSGDIQVRGNGSLLLTIASSGDITPQGDFVRSTGGVWVLSNSPGTSRLSGSIVELVSTGGTITLDSDGNISKPKGIICTFEYDGGASSSEDTIYDDLLLSGVLVDGVRINCSGGYGDTNTANGVCIFSSLQWDSAAGDIKFYGKRVSSTTGVNGTGNILTITNGNAGGVSHFYLRV